MSFTPGSNTVYNSADPTNSYAHTIPTFTANVFTGSWVPTAGYSQLTVQIYSNQASTSNGFKVEQGNDNSNVNYTSSFTVSASTEFACKVAICGDFVRIKFTHGGTDPTTWRVLARLSVT